MYLIVENIRYIVDKSLLNKCNARNENMEYLKGIATRPSKLVAARRVSKSVWKLWRKQKFPLSLDIETRFLSHPACSLVNTPNNFLLFLI